MSQPRSRCLIFLEGCQRHLTLSWAVLRPQTLRGSHPRWGASFLLDLITATSGGHSPHLLPQRPEKTPTHRGQVAASPTLSQALVAATFLPPLPTPSTSPKWEGSASQELSPGRGDKPTNNDSRL